MLEVSVEIDGGVGVVAAGHGILRQQARGRIHTLHGEDLAHHGVLMGFARPDMSHQLLHGGYFSTIKQMRKRRWAR